MSNTTCLLFFLPILIFCNMHFVVFFILFVINILRGYINLPVNLSNIESLNFSVFQSTMQIFEIVNLANELLPPLPQGTISLPSSSNLFVKGSVVKKSSAGSSGKQEDSNGNVPEVSAREKLLNDQPELLQQFGMDLLPVLIQVSFWCA